RITQGDHREEGEDLGGPQRSSALRAHGARSALFAALRPSGSRTSRSLEATVLQLRARFMASRKRRCGSGSRATDATFRDRSYAVKSKTRSSGERPAARAASRKSDASKYLSSGRERRTGR